MADVGASRAAERGDPWTVSDDGCCLDLGPTGVTGFYRMGLATAVMVGVMVLPLGLVGLFGAIAWEDFGGPLRTVMAVAGALAVAVTVGLPCRMLVRAWAWRVRLRATRDGLLVEQGTTRPRLTTWLPRGSTITVAPPKVDELARGGVMISAGETTIRIGIGVPLRRTSALVDAIRGVVAAGAKATLAERPEPSERLGPAWRESLRSLVRDVLRPLRYPTPYVLVDLAAIVAAPLVSSALLAFDWREVYPIAFALFAVGLALRRYDGTYVAGMRSYAEAIDAWGLAYVGAGIAIALFATFGLAPILGLGPAFAASLLVAVGLHVVALRRARHPAPPALPRAADFALAASLVPLSILHESAMFTFVEDSTRGLGPLTLAMVPVVAGFAYLPVRLHAFVDEPGDRANWMWFWITVGWLALLPLLSLGPELARNL